MGWRNGFGGKACGGAQRLQGPLLASSPSLGKLAPHRGVSATPQQQWPLSQTAFSIQRLQGCPCSAETPERLSLRPVQASGVPESCGD